MYSCYAVTFDGASSWNVFAKNGVILGVNDSSSSHADNRMNNSLVLGAGLTYSSNGTFG